MTAPVLSLWKRAAQGWRKMKTRKRRLHDESTRSGRGRERGVAPDANRRECRTLVLNFAPTPVACRLRGRSVRHAARSVQADRGKRPDWSSVQRWRLSRTAHAPGG